MDFQRLWDKEVRACISGVLFLKGDRFSMTKNMARRAPSSVANIFETVRTLNTREITAVDFHVSLPGLLILLGL